MKAPTEPVDATVTRAEIEQAWNNWLSFHHGLNCDETQLRFFNYCHSLEQDHVDDLLDWGSEHDDVRHYGDPRQVAASTAQRIKLLAGPYFNAIISLYYAKFPWK